MYAIQFSLRKSGEGSFFIMLEGTQAGTMEISVRGSLLTVYHTEVAEKEEGKGLAKSLLQSMIAYARENKLMVRPLCPYALVQFKRHPELYNDIWQQEAAVE